MVFVVLVVGGAGSAYWIYREHKQNLPTKIWLPVPTADWTAEERIEDAAMLKEKLSDLALLVQISKDSGYAKSMGFVTDEVAAKDLQRRLFTEIGTADTPSGKVPSINVGFNCKVKEFGRMSKVTNLLKVDIGTLLDRLAFKRQAF